MLNHRLAVMFTVAYFCVMHYQDIGSLTYYRMSAAGVSLHGLNFAIVTKHDDYDKLVYRISKLFMAEQLYHTSELTSIVSE